MSWIKVEKYFRLLFYKCPGKKNMLSSSLTLQALYAPIAVVYGFVCLPHQQPGQDSSI
jgi:hypothetical protein